MVIKHLFSQLLKKAVSMALWTKASLCVKSSLLEQSLPRLVRHPFGGTPSRLKQNQCNLRNLRLKNSCLYSSCSSCLRGEKIREISVNPRLIKDLRPCKVLYNCREDSTTIESSLQIKLFMQNKANFRKVKLNVNNVLTKDYDKMDTWSIRKTKPIQSQLKPIQSQSNPIKANKIPKQTQFKPKQTQFQTNLRRLKLASTSRMIKSFLNFVGPPRVIVGKTALAIRKDPLGISRAKTGNRVCFRN